jgi:signal transduction histidine kinase
VNTYLDADLTKAFFVVNENGLIRFASRQLERIFQQSGTELIDQSIFNLVPNWKGLSLTEIFSNQSEDVPLIKIGADNFQKEAYVRLLEVRADESFGDLEDEIKEFVVSIDFDTALIDKDEEIYNDLTSIDSVIDAVKSLKKGNVSPSEHNYSLQTSLESLYRIKYSQLDKLNRVEEASIEFIDPNTIVKSILSELRFHVGFDEITFEVKNKLIQPFSGDFETIYSILKHLISNAVKYRSIEKEAQSHIHVTFSEKDSLTLIEVVDNGIGIHEDEIEKIFNKGYRGSKSTEGYGLGLFFIQRCLARCNGSISVESELNVGSKFLITL